MTIIPTMIALDATLSLGSYRCAVGISSFRDIITIIPLVQANKTPYTLLVTTLANTAQPKSAAIGSESPLMQPQKKALFLNPDA